MLQSEVTSSGCTVTAHLRPSRIAACKGSGAAQYNARVTFASRRVFLSGLALAITGSVLFSAKAIVIKLAYRYGVDAATLIALRMAFCGPVLRRWPTPGAAAARAAAGARATTAADRLGLLGYYAAST